MMPTLLPLLLLATASSAAPPLVVTVPAQGWSAPTSVQTPAGPLSVAFGFESRVVLVAFNGWRSPTPPELQGAAIEVSPAFEPGAFRTRHFQGERWKCAPSDEKGKWVTESHDDLATSRVALDAETPRESTLRLNLPLRGVLAVSTDRVNVRLALPAAAPVRFALKLESPYVLPPAVAEMLKQYLRLGVAMELSEGRWDHLRFSRVRKDVCGDEAQIEESFDPSTTQTLAFPSHDWRLATAHGWVFAEPIASHREAPIPPAIDITKINPRNMTYLGDLYQRQLAGVDTSPGKATVTFSLGDFSGCLGAGCGDPVNTRSAVVSFANGALSTKIVRPTASPQ